MYLFDLFEAPAYSLQRALEPYADDPDIYVTFTSILKVGINPKTEWNDPVGIYTYPVKELLDTYGPGNVPFAGDRRYVHIVRSAGEMCDLNNMGQDYFEADMQRIYKKFREAFYTPIPSEPHTTREECKEYFDGLFDDWTTRHSHPGIALWKTTGHMASFIENRFKSRDRVVIWNSLLRTCGYDGLVDRGEGIISGNEPAQAVFLHRGALRVIDASPNDLYRPLPKNFR